MRFSSLFKTQKPRVGLLIVLSAFVFSGAGCADIGTRVNGGLAFLQTKIEETKGVLTTWQQNYEKAKAIFKILNSDSAQPPAEESIPSAQPTEDQPQPATEENTSSQSPSPILDASTGQSL